MKRVGLYFGSFNPVHDGHLSLADYVLKHVGLDEVWFVLSPQNPHKDKSVLWDNETRLHLLEKVLRTKKKMRVCTVELELPTPSYTIQTLEVLKEDYPDFEFYILMGADNWEKFDKWKSYEEILDNYKIIVYPRGKHLVDGDLSKHPNVTILSKAPLMSISSTEIREKSGK